ncbi:MAG: hypothetical protein H6683_03385 [Deltaproteobacteria bacterium]|nr:hypothetical protein [Deltaproteobacteria bacterium]MCB9478697.1 hypothetical protein [Deltaproteobacteria bacterium]
MTRPLRSMVATFVMASAVLSTEIILTRVFSVLMWYHFAFMAVCICLFGLGVGSLLLHIFGRNLREDDLPKHLARCAFGFALSQGLAVLILRLFKFGSLGMDMMAMVQMLLAFAVATVPFVFAGFFLGLVFSRGAERIGGLYFADLAGAAVGCYLTISFLEMFGGAGALLASACVALVAGLVMSAQADGRDEFWPQIVLLLLLISVLVGNHFSPFLIFRHTKGNDEPKPVAVDWNSFSRVIAYPRPDVGDIMLQIDGIAHTPITPFAGNAEETQGPMAYVQRVPYEFYKEPSVLIVGSGGGEHILTALAAGSSRVLGIEMNPIVIDMVNKRFAEMAGGLFHYPKVQVEMAEGRSYIARTTEKFDVINFTLVDTWAATAGGAFALTENYLFTEESFNEYFDHLKPGGMLAVKRWRDPPEYCLRMAVIAKKVLDDRGVKNPENCVFIIRDDDFANLLIKPEPFTVSEIEDLLQLSKDYNLEVLYSPYRPDADKEYLAMLQSGRLSDWLDKQDLDLSPTTDNKPFFFHTLRPRDLAATFSQAWASKIRNVGPLILYVLLVGALGVVTAIILGPLFVVRRYRLLFRQHLKAGTYFALIGVGFLTVEIALMQSFILYLGHPTLTLSVFLSTLLVAGGIGAAISSLLGERRPRRAVLLAVMFLVGYALVLRLVAPNIFAETLGLEAKMRSIITVLLLFPLGILMGIPFPMGVRAVKDDGTVPWMFAVNSAASVLGSVMAMVLATLFGFTITILSGLLCYFLAVYVFPAEAIED